MVKGGMKEYLENSTSKLESIKLVWVYAQN